MIDEQDLRAAYRAEVEDVIDESETISSVLQRSRRQRHDRQVAASAAAALAVSGVVLTLGFAGFGDRAGRDVDVARQPTAAPISTSAPRQASPAERHAVMIRCLRDAGWVVEDRQPSPVPEVVPYGETPRPGATGYAGGFSVAVPEGRGDEFEADEARCTASGTLATPGP